MRKAEKRSRADWTNADVGDLWWGHLSGRDLGTKVTVIFYATDTVGEGPNWHMHPYDEIFIITEGHAIFTVGAEKIEAGPGDVLMGPAGVPHKYKNVGPGRLSSIDIHCSPEWIQTDLADPELTGDP
jgi:mannose-6-phosphate isomerase-like protein (cupin superfamily)